MPLCLLCAQTRHSSQIVRRGFSKSSANRVRQAPRLANTPGQPLKASCASCAQGLAPPALCPRCKSSHFRQHSTPCPRSCSTVNRIILNSPSHFIANSLPRHCEERWRRGNLPLHCPPSPSPKSSAIPRIFSKEKGVVYLKNY